MSCGEDLKNHACSFAKWKDEYESIEKHEFHRLVRQWGGSPTVIHESTESIYDKWIARKEMTFSQAMALVQDGKSVTRPRFWAVHRGYFKNINGVIYVFTEYKPDGLPFKNGLSYSDDQVALDWKEIKIS